jgi:hypothetical protein
MKTCPKCAFSNEERFPTCVWCNTSLALVPSTPAAGASDAERERMAQSEQRSSIIRRQSRATVFVYALAITFLAAVPGMIFHPGILALYFGLGLLVGGFVYLGITGQFTSCVLQGALSTVTVISLGPYQPFIFFTLVGHIILPGFLWHGLTMIHDANR